MFSKKSLISKLSISLLILEISTSILTLTSARDKIGTPILSLMNLNII